MNRLAARRSTGSEAHVRFYRRVMETLVRHHVPFLVGGAYALAHYSEVGRTTKDLDLFIRREDWPRLSSVLADHDIATSMPFPHWLGKAQEGDSLVDLVFTSGNGLAPVDDTWYDRAVDGEVLGVNVKICAPEELIWSKAFIMERERFDGADVMHLMRATYHALDWPHLVARFGDHWEVLFSHVVLFGYIYPGLKHAIPLRVLTRLTERLRKRETPARDEALCRGPLLSRAQYILDVEDWGYEDPRVPPHGTMTPNELAIWTDAVPPGSRPRAPE
jgi:putative nucleotidyltransferase-like protein